MRITQNDVILSNGQSVTELLKSLKVPMALVLSVKGGKARLSLPDEYYQSSNDLAATADRISDGLISFGQTIKAIKNACPEDAAMLSPRTYRNIKQQVQVNGQSVMVDSQRSTFVIWFNPDAETRAASNGGSQKASIEELIAEVSTELLTLNPDADLSGLSASVPVQLGQLRAMLRAVKANQITKTADEVEHTESETPEVDDDDAAESVVEGI